MANKKQIHHSHRFWLPFLLVACLIGPNLASAATYYLDADNGNDSNPGTSEQPWQTLGKAKSTVVGGDTVIMAEGNYGEWNQIGGDLYDDWVTFRAADGATVDVSRLRIEGAIDSDAYVIFDGLTVTQAVGISYCVRIAGFNHLKFHNLTIIGDGYLLSDLSGIGIQIFNHANEIDIYNCIISFFNSIPSVITIHCIISTGDRSDFANPNFF